MPRYIVNTRAQDNGDHEVHNLTKGCNYLPDSSNRKDLGWHDDCFGAVRKAKEHFVDSNGCYYCCNDCHTS